MWEGGGQRATGELLLLWVGRRAAGFERHTTAHYARMMSQHLESMYSLTP